MTRVSHGTKKVHLRTVPKLCELRKYLHCFQVYRKNVVQIAQVYLKGLVTLPKRRNMERMSEQYAQEREALHQKLHHFISNTEWDFELANGTVWEEANELLGGHKFTGLFIDPSAFPKRGRHSVGVDRQWCGVKGKVDNCQVGVFCAMGLGEDVCLTGKRLYLPKSWTNDPERMDKAGIPKNHQVYKSHADLALELIEEADHNGAQYAWIGVDAEFGMQPWFLRHLDDAGKTFMAEVPSNQVIYLENPIVEKQASEPFEITYEPRPIKVEEFVKSRGMGYFKKVKIGDRTIPTQPRIMHQRVWVWDKKEEKAHQWHLVVRARKMGKGYQFRYTLSNADPETPIKHLVVMQSQRYLVEKSFRDQKQEIGLAEYQFRGWKAWHKHVTMCFIAGVKILEACIEQTQMDHISFRDMKDILILQLSEAPQRDVEAFERLLYERHLRHERVRKSKLKNSKRKGKKPKSNVT